MRVVRRHYISFYGGEIMVGRGALFRHMDLVDNNLYLWVEVGVNAQGADEGMETWVIRAYADGVMFTANNPLEYLASIRDRNGPSPYHFYRERVPPPAPPAPPAPPEPPRPIRPGIFYHHVDEAHE